MGRLFGRGRKTSGTENEDRKEQIQEEIRRRILQAAKQKSGEMDLADSIEATLDALEGMVNLSREEMERIVEEVQAEFNEDDVSPQGVPSAPPKQEVVERFVFPWTALLLFVVTYYLVRRGSPFYLASGALFVVALLGVMRRWFKD